MVTPTNRQPRTFSRQSFLCALASLFFPAPNAGRCGGRGKKNKATLIAIISGSTQINAPTTSLGWRPDSAPCNPVINLGKRAVNALNRVILEVNHLAPKTPSAAIPKPIPKKASKLRIQPRGRPASRATAKKTPIPSTIPLIFGRLMTTSYVAHRLTSTMQNISSNVALSGVRGSGSRPASQATSHSAGTTNMIGLRSAVGNSKKGVAASSNAQCHLSRKEAIRRIIIWSYTRIRPSALD